MPQALEQSKIISTTTPQKRGNVKVKNTRGRKMNSDNVRIVPEFRERSPRASLKNRPLLHLTSQHKHNSSDSRSGANQISSTPHLIGSLRESVNRFVSLEAVESHRKSLGRRAKQISKKLIRRMPSDAP